MVWIFYAPKRIVEVRTAGEHLLLTEADTLSGGEVLPGFAISVARCFRRLK